MRRKAASENLFPVGDFTGREKGVFAGVPAQEVGGVGVFGVGYAGGPDFVEEVGDGAFGGAVQVVGEAAIFFASGANEGA